MNQGKNNENDKNLCSDAFSMANKNSYEIKPDSEGGPFNQCTRSLLVHYILADIEVKYKTEKNHDKSITGLPKAQRPSAHRRQAAQAGRPADLF